MKRLAQYNEEKLRDKGAAFGWWLKAHAEDHERRVRSAPRSSGSPPRPRAGTSSSTRTPRRCRSSAHKRDALPLMLVMARVIEKEQGDVDRALDMNRQILAIDERNEQALDALERLYLGKGRFEELLDIYDKKLELTGDGDERIAIQSKIGQLYEDEVKDDKKAIAAYRRSSTPPATSRARCARSIAIYLRNAKWKELADVLGRAAHDRRSRRRQARARRAEVPARPGQGAAPRRRRRARSTRTATSSTSTSATRRRATALESPPARRRQAASSIVAGILEPVYEQLGEWAPLVGVHEIQLARREGPLRRTSLLLRIGELQRTQAARRREGVRRVRARVQGRSVDRGREGAARGARAADRGRLGRGWSSCSRRALGQSKDLDPQARARARDSRSRATTRTASATATRRSSSSSKALVDRARRPQRARRARGDLHARREVPRAARDLSPPGRHRERARRAPRLPVPHRLDPRGDARTRPTRRSRPTTRSSARRPMT